jgi:hypothetical protein
MLAAPHNIPRFDMLPRIVRSPVEIAAVRYLLKGAAGSDRSDIVREIMTIVSEVARAVPHDGQDPLDDGMPGG